MKRYLSALIAVLVSFVFLCSCNKAKDTNNLDKYLGDYSYTESAVCMVYEPVEGEFDDEGKPYYGIQYREIKDLEGLLSSGSVIMIYFYSSMSNDTSAITALVEDMAQNYSGRLTVVMLDAMEYRTYMDKYEIEAVPEFVLIKPGQQDQVFGSLKYDYWTMSDVLVWLQSNGVT